MVVCSGVVGVVGAVKYTDGVCGVVGVAQVMVVVLAAIVVVVVVGMTRRLLGTLGSERRRHMPRRNWNTHFQQFRNNW